MLSSTSAIIRSSARPRPIDSTTAAAGDPGRWIDFSAFLSIALGAGGSSLSPRCMRNAARRRIAKASTAPAAYQPTASGWPVSAMATSSRPAALTSIGTRMCGLSSTRQLDAAPAEAAAERNSCAGRSVSARLSGR